MIDEKLSYREHLDSACQRASKTVSSLSRIMANTMGLRTKKRRVLFEVVHSVLLYGAEIWADILKQKTYRRKIAAVQRRGAVRVACAYRTVSEAAILVIAGATLIDLLAFERAKLYGAKRKCDNFKEAKTRIKAETQQEWQDRWTTGKTNGLTLMCKYCPDKIDDAEHTFFECARWKDYRSSTEEIIGARLSPSSLVTSMIEQEGNWSAIATYAQRLLKDKISERDQ
ncbi:uncharacterized protein LOC132696366 [Cylas formicarius]|uniref:uncharacterized protein LOC132696366 n=1 Tax=Cylas formicarius TaxID=197179 RepID=UPI002958B5A4|nr:uncharacterized protein LOC132696366 [Cylas formicarius]